MTEKKTKTILLRLNPKMWEEISKWADEEFRSINGQIEYLLHDAIVRKRKKRLEFNAEEENEEM